MRAENVVHNNPEGIGIINATSLNIGLVSEACGLFLMLALRNIYQIKQCRTDITKFRTS